MKVDHRGSYSEKDVGQVCEGEDVCVCVCGRGAVFLVQCYIINRSNREISIYPNNRYIQYKLIL